jgi:signal transduction histidine kinase
MLQTLAGPVPVADGIGIALHALRDGLNADEAALVTMTPDGGATCRAYSGPREPVPDSTLALAATAIAGQTTPTEPGTPAADGAARLTGDESEGPCRSVTFGAPGGRTVLLARWRDAAAGDTTDLLEDAARSFRMALEKEEALAAQQEAMALRQSQKMQHAFLRRLSHELRTPLTAITGYATSLLQRDVTWDADTQHRFLSRIAAESSRLGRLVNDLLDFSAIETGIFRLQCDWCDLPLVIDAAVAVLPPDRAPMVEVKTPVDLPVVWADHDRLEQVFVNLIGNALSHNPPGTRVQVTAEAPESSRAAESAPVPTITVPTVTVPTVTVLVADDGAGIPPETLSKPPPIAGQSRGRGAGAGLGLSIAQGIVAAHGGSMTLEPATRGTCFSITLPVEMPHIHE